MTTAPEISTDPIPASAPMPAAQSRNMLPSTSSTLAPDARYLEVGTRHPLDLTTCSDIDLMSSNADGRFVHKDGTPYAET